MRRFVRAGGHRLEYAVFESARGGAGDPPIVLLHEGLGSVAMWKDFPSRLAQATGHTVLAYSRYGYGRSDALTDPRDALAVHEEEALDVLPELLERLEIERPVLFGHSDGGSIALIYAGGSGRVVSGVVVLAPHVMVEDICITSIRAAKEAYLTTELPEKLAHYHADPDSAFWSWNDLWLDPAFRLWNIERFLTRIDCPVLAIQGHQDEYGTMEQLDRLAQGIRDVTLLKLDACGHSPHRDQPGQVLEATARFVDRLPIDGDCRRPAGAGRFGAPLSGC